MKKYLTKENIMKLFMIFIIIQPVIDIYLLFKPEVADFFGFSPSTIIRIVLAGILILSVIFTIKIKKIHLWFVAYGGLVLGYVILHHLNALHFTSVVPGDFGYTLTSELFYIIRMLLPLAMIVVSYYLELKDDKLNTTIKWLVILISGSIVVTNLLGISLGSYSKMTIKGNIFSWFLGGYEEFGYLELASKGFFNDPNRMAALLSLITPVLFYCFMKKPKLSNGILIVIQFLGMYMLGTRVATFGFLVPLVVSIFVYWYFVWIKKEFKFKWKINNTFLVVLLVAIAFIPYSPALHRIETDVNANEDYNNNISTQKKNEKELLNTTDQILLSMAKEVENTHHFEENINYIPGDDQNIYISDKYLLMLDKESGKKVIIDFIAKNNTVFGVNPQFIFDSYPYQYDPYFWYEIYKQPLEVRNNFRGIEKAMLERVKTINNNPNDEFFGITFTRMSNIFDLERDFQSHYYTLGYVGLLLFLFPYLIITFLCGFMMLFQYKKNFNARNVMMMLGILIALFAAFYSGNVMDGLVVTLILGAIIGQLVANIFKNKPKPNNEKVSLIMPTYNDSATIRESLDSIMIQDYKNWELIIVDDGSTDDTKKVIDEYKKKHDKNNQITYLYEENSDQLNAILYAQKHITGDFVYITHSDDLLHDSKVLSQAVEFMCANPETDAIIADSPIIDGKSKITGNLEVSDYHKTDYMPPLQLLWLGRNYYIDVAFYRRAIFDTLVVKNYVTWNMPFWLDCQGKPKQLSVFKVEFPFMKYRVYEENYIHNPNGQLNVINGEIRTLTNLMKHYDIPFYKAQYLLFRAFHTFDFTYVPLYLRRETKKKSQIVNFTIQKRFPEGVNNNTFLYSLEHFYQNHQKRAITMPKIGDEFLYFGKDAKIFNKNLQDKKLSKTYVFLLQEMEKGFDEIILTDKKETEKMSIILQFLCIEPYVKITK